MKKIIIGLFVLYDWARDGWQEGHISIEFVRNE
jgi:hypothetical protein